MPLSEYEQRVLEQMERQLTSDDPRLANTLQSRGGRPRGIGRWVLVGVGFVGGLLLLVAGAAMSQLWLGVIGFLLMFGAVAYAFAGPQSSGPAGVVAQRRLGRRRATARGKKPAPRGRASWPASRSAGTAGATRAADRRPGRRRTARDHRRTRRPAHRAGRRCVRGRRRPGRAAGTRGARPGRRRARPARGVPAAERPGAHALGRLGRRGPGGGTPAVSRPACPSVRPGDLAEHRGDPLLELGVLPDPRGHRVPVVLDRAREVAQRRPGGRVHRGAAALLDLRGDERDRLPGRVRVGPDDPGGGQAPAQVRPGDLRPELLGDVEPPSQEPRRPRPGAGPRRRRSPGRASRPTARRRPRRRSAARAPWTAAASPAEPPSGRPRARAKLFWLANGSAHRGGAPVTAPGVGSKRIHPASGKYSSGQACESRPVTTYWPSSFAEPGRKPTARRAGMSSIRAMTVIAVANWTQ